MKGGRQRKTKAEMGPDDDDPFPIGNKDAERERQLAAEESAEKPKPSSEVDGGGEEESLLDPNCRIWSDQDLSATIARMKATLKVMGKNLPDGGEKLRVNIMRHEAELQSRKIRRDDEKCRKLIQSINNRTCTGELDFTGPRDPSSAPSSLSVFSSSFCSSLDDKTAHLTINVPGKDISTLMQCGRKNTRVDRRFSARRIKKRGSSFRQKPFQTSNHLPVKVVEQSLSNDERKRNLSPTPSPCHFEDDLSGRLTKNTDFCNLYMLCCCLSTCTFWIAACIQPSQNIRYDNGKSIVLEDEEEPEVPEKARKADQVYDPESVEFYCSDLECLAPQSYLSSDIMNYYIRLKVLVLLHLKAVCLCTWVVKRNKWGEAKAVNIHLMICGSALRRYLQKPASSTDTERHKYHFFNTYFYEKLKQDVLRKNKLETSFVKFRRWWKGINIFEKAYIFLPIHEDLHWSLVIICIPDKEDESGPILLHLDSLKFHSSKSIFNNIRSFLIEEWKFLRQGESKSQCLIADKIWRKLSRRIDEKIIEVPQQQNDYDCGLFVLYFMERFLEDAPERLKKKDLTMFGRRWFKPQEASSLRRKIKILLKEEFKNANAGKSVLNPEVPS
ncbi:ubiquitin-like-specific protease 1D [Olea europaea var. sylvestris]|uniref:ubiquitin-like-specific protease 1D n=1 Tax=Olea europaea var. sylvestris TaxID=158386 RepID=UPI000C1CD0E0|nr:ubiquitin-like-specific protease 1D [Olea europaea var. sylvestris]